MKAITVKHVNLKDAAMILTGLVIAVALFFTVGSRTRTNDRYVNQDGQVVTLTGLCGGLNIPTDLSPDSAEYKALARCEPPPEAVEKGWPLAYRTHDATAVSNLILDMGLWLIAGGVVAFGGYMLIPDKKKK